MDNNYKEELKKLLKDCVVDPSNNQREKLLKISERDFKRT